MAYIDRAGLESRFGVSEIAGLIDDDSSGSETPSEVDSLTKACADSSSLIDGYLAARYPLPLANVPEIVAGWAGDIARFKLWDNHAPEEVRKRYEDALAQLRDLARGLISLPPDAQGNQPTAGLAIEGYSADRIFTMDSLSGF